MRDTCGDPDGAVVVLPAVTTPRRLVGAAIALAGLVLLGLQFADGVLQLDPRVRAALGGGLLAAGATALGTLPVLFAQRLSVRSSHGLLGFGAGVMLAASVLSLTVPALAAGRAQGLGGWSAGGLVGTGILLGAASLLLLDRWSRRRGERMGLGDEASALQRSWLFVFAIAAHNLPEGLAIGVAFAGQDLAQAQALATGISIQDVPEGLVVALALRQAGYRATVSAAIGAASGLVEPLAAVIGAVAITVSASLLPWGLAAAAGAMLFVIVHHVIPSAHERGTSTWATGGLMLGFVLMMLLDTALA